MKGQATIFVVISILIAAISVCFIPANGAPNIIPGSELAQAVGGPPCTGRDPHVAMPGAPHGMYVWAPGERMTALLKKYVIGKDPTLCGASIVVKWADVEKSKGSFDFGPAEELAKPFTDAGLTVNFLFADATEGKDEVTPRWVLQEVPTTSCGAEAKLPVYWNSKFEADWTALIRHAIDYFSNKSPIRNKVGYLRFATGGGAEAIGPPGSYGGDCSKPIAKLGYSYDVWKTHVLKILEVMGSANSTHQIIAALPQQPGGKSQFELTNEFAAAAAAKHVGLSFESLGGEGNVAAPGSKPGRCDPKSKLHWCQPFIKFAGVVPLAMQPITATRNTNHGKLDISNLLQYALDNKIQIFELYPDEWLEADGVKEWQPFEPAKQAKYKAALQSASLVLGQAPTR